MLLPLFSLRGICNLLLLVPEACVDHHCCSKGAHNMIFVTNNFFISQESWMTGEFRKGRESDFFLYYSVINKFGIFSIFVKDCYDLSN